MEAARAARSSASSRGEAFRPAGELYEQAANRRAVYTLRRPLGVVALITPWNFPAAIPVWKLAPALIYGNTVVIKLAQEAPLHRPAPRRVLRRGRAAGRASSTSSSGRGSRSATPLVRHRSVRAISFTGSVAVGAPGARRGDGLGKRVQLELGGHNPLIVMADADLDRAVEAAYAGAFWSAGQKCTATRRIYVQDAGLRRRSASSCSRGSSAARSATRPTPTTEVGPIVNETAARRGPRGDRARQERGRHGARRAASAPTTRPT